MCGPTAEFQPKGHLVTLYLSNENQDELLEWARERITMTGQWPDGSRAMGVLCSSGKIRAVMVTVETYTGIIDLHFASDGSRSWASRNILGGLFGYLFFVRGARRVQTVSSPSDDATVVMNWKLGFTFEAHLVAAMDDGGPGVLMSMTPETCKWIKEKADG